MKPNSSIAQRAFGWVGLVVVLVGLMMIAYGTYQSRKSRPRFVIEPPGYERIPTDRTYHLSIRSDMIQTYDPPNARRDMCVCEICIGDDHAQKTERMAQNRRAYVRSQRLPYHVLRTSPHPNMHAAFQKIPLVRYLMDRYRYEWIVVVDTDLIVTNPSHRFDDLTDETCDFVFSTWTSKHGTVLQSSAFLIRNCSLAREYLDAVWKSCLYRKTFFVADPHLEDWGEQTHMDLIAREPAFRERAKFVSRDAFQCTSGVHCKDACTEGEKAFLAHPIKDPTTMERVLNGTCSRT